MEETKTLEQSLQLVPKSWLVTGAAGFIGSNLLQALLRLNQRVVGLDNFSTGKQKNLEQVQELVTPEQWKRFRFIRGDIREILICREACKAVDFVLHQAALGSVTRSLEDPVQTHESNVTGFLNMLLASRDAQIKRFVYASSRSVYGDHPGLPKVEDDLGNCLSPYALSKRIDELYANIFTQCYGTECIGLRYFNVFGPRQDPSGPYAAVIPKWIYSMLLNQPVQINGDGESSRDFCYVANVVQANLLAATTQNAEARNRVYNIAVGGRTTLNELFIMLREQLKRCDLPVSEVEPLYGEFRPGDVRHSQADISSARRLLGYEPSHSITQGLDEAFEWYLANAPRTTSSPLLAY
jgi:UDP-N-acetylglucosamine/UDP-N-acetylgalactosamine 4-epimerase